MKNGCTVEAVNGSSKYINGKQRRRIVRGSLTKGSIVNRTGLYKNASEKSFLIRDMIRTGKFVNSGDKKDKDNDEEIKKRKQQDSGNELDKEAYDSPFSSKLSRSQKRQRGINNRRMVKRISLNSGMRTRKV